MYWYLDETEKGIHFPENKGHSEKIGARKIFHETKLYMFFKEVSIFNTRLITINTRLIHVWLIIFPVSYQTYSISKSKY